jgi:uncharacterized protein (DUF433 family)
MTAARDRPAITREVARTTGHGWARAVGWDDDLPVAWRPDDNDASPVRCRPTLRFGRPSIGGQHEAIVEHLYGGEDEEEVPEQFDLSLDDVRWAMLVRALSPRARGGLKPAEGRLVECHRGGWRAVGC